MPVHALVWRCHNAYHADKCVRFARLLLQAVSLPTRMHCRRQLTAGQHL